MKYDDWLATVPPEITADSLWKMEAYRLALFFSDIVWHDVTKLIGDRRTRDLADQLYRAAGSISANIAEGYSRGTSKDRARFYEYALGSARESRDWHFKGRFVLGESVVKHRLQLVTQIIRLLLTMIPQQRDAAIREDAVDYQMMPVSSQPSESSNTSSANLLLEEVPLP